MGEADITVFTFSESARSTRCTFHALSIVSPEFCEDQPYFNGECGHGSLVPRREQMIHAPQGQDNALSVRRSKAKVWVYENQVQPLLTWAGLMSLSSRSLLGREYTG